jgi:hypothetical protein
MGELQIYRDPGSIQPNTKRLHGTITVGAAGAISAQTGQRNSGVTFVKNATAGRYDATLHRSYRRVMAAPEPSVSSPTAGDVPVVTDGNFAYLNGITAANFAGTSGISTFTIQCCTSNGVATAANPKSGDTISWSLVVSDSP